MLDFFLFFMLPLDELLDSGLIILDKPTGQSSHEISSWVKKIVGSSRAGHAGTLDPQVSGVLPIALGRATKLIRYLTAKDKVYVGIVKFRKILSRWEIERLFSSFTGTLIQTPPKESAVRRIPRKRTVHYLKILAIHNRLVLFETRVDAGTYIRTLCDDMGRKAGGARMVELRRIAVGGITESQCVTIQELIDAMWLLKNRQDDSELRRIIHPIWDFLKFKRIYVKNSAVQSLLSGAQLMAPGMKDFDESIRKNETVSLYSEDRRFVGVGISLFSAEELAQKTTGQVVKTVRIHLKKH